jgi:hypothetical protein
LAPARSDAFVGPTPTASNTPQAALALDTHQIDLKTLQYEVRPLRPGLDFSFQFHTGYGVIVPLSQYRGPHHHWTIMLRVQPETGADPVYLEDSLNLPNVPNTEMYAQYGQSVGSFLVGEGLYRISFLLVDDQQRGCPAEWRIRVRRDSTNHGIWLSIAPGMILPTSEASRMGGQTQIPAPVERLTVTVGCRIGIADWADDFDDAV